MRPVHTLTLVPAAILFASACSDAPPTGAGNEVPVGFATRRASLLAEAQKHPRGIEDEMINLDIRIGGFGGFYRDSSGTFVAFTTEQSNEPLVRAELGALVGRLGLAQDAGGGIEIRVAKHRFSDLIAYQQLAAEVLRGPRSAAWTDADERLNAVRIGLYDLRQRDEVEGLLRRAGVPPEALVIEQGRAEQAATTLRDKFRPTGGGIQVKTFDGLNHLWTCTLGFNVTSASSGARYMLYNSHCTGDITGGTGRSVYQKDFVSGDLMGTVSVNPAWQTLLDPACGGVANCRYSDAALVSQSLSISNTPKRLIAPCGYSTNPTQPGTITYASWCGFIFSLADGATVLPYVGQGLQKIGRTSGWTVGLVTETCVNIDADFEGQPVRVLCADRVGAYADLADSGSPVFFAAPGLPSNTVAPMGVLFSVKLDDTTQSPSPRSFSFSRRQMIQLDLGTLVF